MPWPCADFNGDNRVLIQDILYVVQRYFTTDPAADLDDDGIVTVNDILIALSQYGITCPRRRQARITPQRTRELFGEGELVAGGGAALPRSCLWAAR